MGARPILLAAGGTGGHLFPAEALAAELVRRGRSVALITDARGKGFGDRLAAVPVHRIHAASLSARGVPARLRALGQLALGTLQSGALMTRLRPEVVVGFGGYPSVPALAAAALTGRRMVLHEQNAVLGRANRLFSSRAAAIATSIDETTGVPKGRSVLTGNPVRGDFLVLAGRHYAEPTGQDPIELVITGGSQGAAVFSSVVPSALVALPEALRARLHLTQQCRAEDLETVRAAYASAGIRAELAPFFSDLAARIGTAHLALCRAGASTLAELAVAGVPAILVPYPHAADDHQTANASVAERAGGGWLFRQSEFTAERLAELLGRLLTEPGRLSMAAASMRKLGIVDAASRLADLVETTGGCR